ncbi:MAG: sulfate reduction electron transfer complex DsrMKJOP subunit DsrM [Acidobacteriia bacterium]|nr:sulfate reduction electron transfer complex DsrMKJOP subunit DsrM [Terriglobia bacterium]
MNFLYALIAVLALIALALFGDDAAGLRPFFAIIIPYAAIAIFLTGVAYRVLKWARSAVPFRIPTTSGQQQSLPWIKSGRLESPSTKVGVAARMALEILLFRSLFRNTRADVRNRPRMVYGEEKFLWLGALAFHWSFLIIFLRHLRFFMEPVPGLVLVLQSLDGFFQVGTPVLYLTDVIIIIALVYLLLRRLRNPQLRYISLFTDYFALCMLLGLAATGIWMRYLAKVDILPIKEIAVGLVTFSPRIPEGAAPLFNAHLLLVCTLLAYFPFSKLMHLAGVFLSPTRNLSNNNRMNRHVNPWDYPVKVHTYEEWEDEFRDKIAAAGLPLERQ